MFDFFSFSLELPPIFRFHSLWLSGDIYSDFQDNCISFCKYMLGKELSRQGPVFCIKDCPCISTTVFCLMRLQVNAYFFLGFYIATLSVSCLV